MSTAMNGERRATEIEIERTTEALIDKAHQLEQRVVETKERLEERVVRTKEKIEHMVDPREQVRDHPWGAIGVAVALGFLVGWWS